jgi:hypothetical protein
VQLLRKLKVGLEHVYLLYGLKQAARVWYRKLRTIMEELGYESSEVDPCLFRRGAGAQRIVVTVHVDDGIITGSKMLVGEALGELAQKLKIKNLGAADEFLSLQLRRQEGRLWLGQEGYIMELVERFGMDDAAAVKNPVATGQTFCKEGTDVPPGTPYAEAVGALLYLATMTRPDISYAVGVLCRYMQAPKVEHWKGVKRVLRYLKGTAALGIVYRTGGGGAVAYADSDFAMDPDSRRSRSGVIILLSGGPVIWTSKLQATVAMSTCEAEISSGAAAAREALWV